ncbi:isoprenylcysteine carboxylmethyltransferase family protein [Candidatus Pacearchaeota archaeon]|nr:isoprenylcysteine carboxylmethyltransferase family protein [Candidatus Pacearchaeota archaeon]
MKLKFDVANTFLACIVLNIILHCFIPIKQIISYPYTYIGLIFFILGWIPNIWIYLIYRKYKNPVPAKDTPKVLITSGLFKISRNPNYLGMIITLFGEAIFLGSLIVFIIPVLFFILINITNIPFEERVLERKFGRKYLNYKRRVRRWI